MRRNQQGIAHYGLMAVVALVFVGLGLVAYNMVNKTSSDSVSGVVTIGPSMPASITNTADVRKASSALNKTDMSALDPSVMDADLNALL